MTLEAELAGRGPAFVYLIELGFASGTHHVSSWNHAIDWAGHTWLGLSSLLSVSAVTESEQLQYPGLELGLNVANSALLALALGSVAEYRRRPITLYRGVLDEQLRPVDAPELAWAGLMDQVRLSTGNGEGDPGGLVLRCELPGRDGRAAQGLRLNHAQQQARHPGDTGLSRIEQLTGQPRPWLSKRFQRI